MAIKINTARDFHVGQVVNISKRVLSPAAGKSARVTSIDIDANEVIITVGDGERRRFSPLWLTPLDAAGKGIGWVTLVGQDGTSRPVTVVGHNADGSAHYIEGHVEIRVTSSDNLFITN